MKPHCPVGLPVILHWTHCPFVVYVFCSPCTPLGCKKEVSCCLLGSAFYTILTKTTLWISFSFFFFTAESVCGGWTFWMVALYRIVFKSNTFTSASFCFPSIFQAVIFTSEKVWVTVMSFILPSLAFSPLSFFFCLLSFYTLVWINDMTLARQNSTVCPSYSIFSIWERKRNLKYLTGQRFRPKNDLARLSIFLSNVYLMSHRDHRGWVNVCENETERAGNVGWEQKRERLADSAEGLS